MVETAHFEIGLPLLLATSASERLDVRCGGERKRLPSLQEHDLVRLGSWLIERFVWQGSAAYAFELGGRGGEALEIEFGGACVNGSLRWKGADRRLRMEPLSGAAKLVLDRGRATVLCPSEPNESPDSDPTPTKTSSDIDWLQQEKRRIEEVLKALKN